MSQNFAVVGAGVVGLASAVQLQKAFPSTAVTIIAEKFMEGTTSIGAAGIYRPSPTVSPGTPYDILKLLTDSWNYFHSLVHSTDAAEAGSEVIGGYEFYNTEKDMDFRRKTVYALDKVGNKEMNIYPGPRFSFGYRTTSILTSPVRFLPYLSKQFIANGGIFEKRKLMTLEELVGKYDVVVNCSGMGARELVGDSKVYASRGQIIKINAPWIKTYLYAEDGKGNIVYIYPTPDFVVVGGLRQINDEYPQPREADKHGIWKHATEMVPSLERAEVIADWVGLRPMRDSLRLETEIMKFKSGMLKVVHNYGHGAGGVSLSWGTGSHVVKLVQRIVNEKQRTSKL